MKLAQPTALTIRGAPHTNVMKPALNWSSPIPRSVHQDHNPIPARRQSCTVQTSQEKLHNPLLVILLLLAVGLLLVVTANQGLDDVDGALRATGLGREDLALLVHNKDAPLRPLGVLRQADGADERGGRVAQERVRQLVLGAERGVGLARVAREPEDGEARLGEVLVAVAEEADLLGA